MTTCYVPMIGAALPRGRGGVTSYGRRCGGDGGGHGAKMSPLPNMGAARTAPTKLSSTKSSITYYDLRRLWSRRVRGGRKGTEPPVNGSLVVASANKKHGRRTTSDGGKGRATDLKPASVLVSFRSSFFRGPSCRHPEVVKKH